MWRRVMRDTLILSGGVGSLVVLQLVYRYLAVRELPVASYGRVALLLSVFNGASIVGTYGIPATVSRLAARTDGRERDRSLLVAASRAVICPTVLASVVMAAATWVVTRSGYDSVVALVGVAPATWAGLYSGYIRGKGRIWEAAAVGPLNIAVQVVVLVALVAAGVQVGIGLVLGSFYVGNFGALAVSLYWTRTTHRSRPAENDPLDPDATTGRILGFTLWLALANLAVVLLAVLPRAFLARVSYHDVADLDLALLVYAVPQRLRSSFLVALLPLAAVAHKTRVKLSVPDSVDLLLVSLVVGVLDLALWWSHLLRLLLRLVGMHAYTGAEPLLLIVLLALPAEIFFGVNSGLLQAHGRSRQLGFASLGVLAASTAAMPIAWIAGPAFLAGLLAADYWVLHVVTRRMLVACDIVEEPVLTRAVVTWLRRVGRAQAPLTEA